MNYYNEFDPFAAEWLRNLIAAGAIPAGHVDERSIVDVTPGDLAGYNQCHFFAGIGGWPLALQMAGVPDYTRLWTGSCPCQPFSVAGKGKGEADERHLWPVWFELVRAVRPELVFGEQVASKSALGWWDGVRGDLEGEDYACGEACLGAFSVGADHQRQRLYWMAVANGSRWPTTRRGCAFDAGRQFEPGQPICRLVLTGGEGLEGYSGDGNGSNKPGRLDSDSPRPTASTSDAGGVGNAESLRKRSGHGSADSSTRIIMERTGARSDIKYGNKDVGRLADSGCERDERRGILGELAGKGGSVETETREWERRRDAAGDCRTARAWADSCWLACSDGKLRRVPSEPSLFPVADGVSRRDMEQVRAILAGMGLSPEGIKRALRKPRSLVALAGRHRAGILKGAGNAIVPEVAAEFITAAFETINS